MQLIEQWLDAGIIEQARRHRRMTSSLRACLPAATAEHCWAGGIHGAQLVVIIDEAELAVRLRYYQYGLLKQLNEAFGAELPQPLSRLRVKVADFGAQARPTAARPVLSARNAALLASTAKGLNDEALRQVLLRLAARGGSDNV